MTTLLIDGLAKAAAGVTLLAEVWRVVHVDRVNGAGNADGGVAQPGGGAVKQSSDLAVAGASR